MPTSNPASEGFDPARLDRMHTTLHGLVDSGKFSGYVTLIARDGKIVDWRAYGMADIGVGRPMRKDTIFRIYSMSKIVTTVGILMLIEDGKLLLSDPVERYLPELAHPQVMVGGTADQPELEDVARPVTIRDLLTHSGGYYYGWSGEGELDTLFNRVDPFGAADLDGFLSRVAQLPLADQPGTRWRYSISMDILGAVIERVSGQSFDDFLRTRLFEPLDMPDTGFWVPEAKQERKALIYTPGEGGRLVLADKGNNEHPGPHTGLRSGGGGLFSTAGDYVRFAQMLLNGGELDGVRIISPHSVAQMSGNCIANLDDPHPFGNLDMGYGLGVAVITDPWQGNMLETKGTFLWDGAATTTVRMDPSNRLVAILMMQHMPFNEHNVFATFLNGYYSALIR